MNTDGVEIPLQMNHALAKQIEEAFADTPYPGDAFEAISATPYDEGIVEYFRGTTWKGHQVRNLRCHSAALSFFTDAAYRYWLPAFMLAHLENPGEADVIAEHIAHDFTKHNRVEVFNQKELSAIRLFFHALCTGDDVHEIYDHLYRSAANVVEVWLALLSEAASPHR